MKAGRYRKSPGPEDLFKVNIESLELDPARKEEYHKVTAKTLWLSQRSRPDIQSATGYHCTRVKNPNEQDYDNMTWLQRYVWWTRFLPTVIEITEDGAIIHIDGSHTVHADSIKRTLRNVYNHGPWCYHEHSKKTRIEHGQLNGIVSSGKRMPKCTWFQYFRLAQGDKPIKDILI